MLSQKHTNTNLKPFDLKIKANKLSITIKCFLQTYIVSYSTYSTTLLNESCSRNSIYMDFSLS